MQKLASAAQSFVAKGVLLKTQNQFLHKINRITTTRRETKSKILGRAKVMSYVELADARAKRASKDKAAEARKRQGRKRKGKAPVVENNNPSATARALKASVAVPASTPESVGNRSSQA